MMKEDIQLLELCSALTSHVVGLVVEVMDSVASPQTRELPKLTQATVMYQNGDFAAQVVDICRGGSYDFPSITAADCDF
jgi:hypothetical protein